MAQCFQAKRIRTATKRIYSSRMRIMLEWIRSKHPAAMEADGINCQLPLPKDAVLGFFGHLIEPAHECDINNTHADNASSATVCVLRGGLSQRFSRFVSCVIFNRNEHTGYGADHTILNN